jgi:hypothetical protein
VLGEYVKVKRAYVKSDQDINVISVKENGSASEQDWGFRLTQRLTKKSMRAEPFE